MTHHNQQKRKKKWRGHQNPQRQQGQRHDPHSGDHQQNHQRQRPDQELRPPTSRFARTERPSPLPLADQPVRYDLIERGFRRDPLITDDDQPFYLRGVGSRS